MAATRSAWTVLSRGASASLGGRALQIHQVFRPTATRMLQPYLSPAGRNKLESSMRFSTEGRNKADSVLNMLGQWSKDCMRNVRKAGSGKSFVVCTMIVNVAAVSFTFTNSWKSRQSRA